MTQMKTQALARFSLGFESWLAHFLLLAHDVLIDYDYAELELNAIILLPIAPYSY